MTRPGKVGGTLVTIFYNFEIAHLVKTAIPAAIGAVVSFAVSMAL
ncbi:hypothetical protein ACFOW1_12500 [Parasediminibacterium paludis]|uniref:Uncharacterized protein n=1 Tax=Parasediminibacterium paludis TaxID=908966 RepID=A0ABV8PZQ7_9BACT